MPPLELRQRLLANPFRPFRIVMLDGKTYDVRHRDWLMVGMGVAVVGLPAREEDELFSVTDTIDTDHVTRLEPLPATTQTVS